MGDDGVVQGDALERDLHHVAPGVVHGLLHGHRNFARLAAADADLAGTVADHGQRRKPEQPPALDRLGHAPDVDELSMKLSVWTSVSPYFFMSGS